ncbi:hypothetical protein EVAR_52439_1 [Eumeta japonica]|uniref:Uncharacterized protein n=1 Tax=Eumeta variegata TaxID=151549 RepID=A0A4C1YP94_EUMVA|nr:hypothetical protein EVAR_52439_1 [Eumeta japonica]
MRNIYNENVAGQWDPPHRNKDRDVPDLPIDIYALRQRPPPTLSTVSCLPLLLPEGVLRSFSGRLPVFLLYDLGFKYHPLDTKLSPVCSTFPFGSGAWSFDVFDRPKEINFSYGDADLETGNAQSHAGRRPDSGRAIRIVPADARSPGSLTSGINPPTDSGRRRGAF